MNRTFATLAFILAGWILPAGPARAQVPVVVQGYLERDDEGPVDGEHVTLVFRVYRQGDEDPLAQSIDEPFVHHGLFVAVLPELADNPEVQAALFRGEPLWLEVEVQDDEHAPDLLGRVPIRAGLTTVFASTAARAGEINACQAEEGGPGVPLIEADGPPVCIRFATFEQLAQETQRLTGHVADAAMHPPEFTAGEAVQAVNADPDHWMMAEHPRNLVPRSDLAAVAFSGEVGDLNGALTADEAVQAVNTDPDHWTMAEHPREDLVSRGDLAAVAFSGEVGDVNGAVTADEAVQAVNADPDHWMMAEHPRNLVSQSDLAAVAFSGEARDVDGALTAGEAVQAVNADPDHWMMAEHPRNLVSRNDLAAVAFSGEADDVNGALTAGEAVQAVNADLDHWTMAEHSSDLAPRSDLAAVAFSGEAGDLTGEAPEEIIPQTILDRLDQIEAVTQVNVQLAERIASLEAEVQRLSGPLPYPADGPLLIYVAQNRGSDENSGLTYDDAKASIQAAWNVLPRFVVGDVEIRVEEGDYTGGIQLVDKEAADGKAIQIRGVGGDRSEVNISCRGPGGTTHGVRVSNTRGLKLSNLTVSRCRYGIVAERYSRIELGNIHVTGNSGGVGFAYWTHAVVRDNCLIDGNTPEFGISLGWFSQVDVGETEVRANGNDDADPRIGIVVFQSSSLHCGGNLVVASNDIVVQLYSGTDMCSPGHYAGYEGGAEYRCDREGPGACGR